MSENFQSFFSTALGNDIHPYEYQQGLAEQDWPDALIAPTGLGKTAAAVLSWAWKHAMGKQHNPRRLVYCLPMRTLVNQTERNVTKWLQRLRKANSEWKSRLPEPTDDVHILMGGVDETRWFEKPEKPAILIGTQDMLISRALMRGYAMSRFRWPVDFALLHNDAQWVFDEVQLMGSGLATSTQLEGFRRSFGTEIGARSLWISATLHPDWLKSIDLCEQNLKVWKVPDDFPKDSKSPQVRKLIDAPKPIQKSKITLAGTKKDDLRDYAKALATEAISMHRKNRMTLVVVNTVARAQAVHGAIKKQGFLPDHLALIHSRFRPADRRTQMEKLPEPGREKDLIAVATQAIEAGVDISSAVMLTEIASASSFVQRLGRVNRYGELNDSGGGNVHWIDIPSDSSEADKDAKTLSAPYTPEELEICRGRVAELSDARSSNLKPPGPDDCTSQSVIRDKDITDLYDTDPDLTGFDVDISPYIRDGEDTDVRVFWRDLSDGYQKQPLPIRDELCAVPIGRCSSWLRSKKFRAFRLDPLSNKNRPAWIPFKDFPWPGLVLMIDKQEGGYTSEAGFDPNSKAEVEPVRLMDTQADSHEAIDADTDSRQDSFVKLQDHLIHVKNEAESICAALNINSDQRKLISTAAHWHDVGKAHEAFQERMSTKDPNQHPRPECLLAKALYYDRVKGRPYFRHELASALAYLSYTNWSRDADLTAYLIASHHGKVRMNLRALPAEKPPDSQITGKQNQLDARRFARGVWEDDNLPKVEINGDMLWAGGRLTLSVMELGEHPITGSSWTERTHSLLSKHGPFRLAWMEAVLRIADWRASAKEQETI